MADRASIPPEDLQFGELVVGQGLCSRERVQECISFLGRLIAEGVTPVPRLGELLLRKGYLSPAQFDSTLRPAPAPRADAEGGLPAEVASAAANPLNIFGRYVKVSLLGAGGMGEVWKAWDRDLGRWAALKFLHHSDPGQIARFRREAQTAAALSHPNIASVYEVGEAQGKPYIALQLVLGRTLAVIPRNEISELVRLVRDAALAVQYANERGIIHRDLKPANLMVEGSRIYVMDFGLAKPSQTASSLSVSGAILGTPAYMPPEQARGESSTVTPASDVYALGATLYELLTNRPPFEDPEVYALLRKVIEDDPVPVRKLNSRIAPDLETIVMKCLEKEPGRRYATAGALAEEMSRWLKGEAIEAHPPSLFYKARKFVSRRKAVTSMAAAAVLAVGILLPVWLAERGRRKALLELGELRAQMLVVQEWTKQPFRDAGEIRRELARHLGQIDGFVAQHPDLPQGFFVRAQGRFLQGRFTKAVDDLNAALRLDGSFGPAWTLLGRVKLEQYDEGLMAASDYELPTRRAAGRALLLEATEALRKAAATGSDSMAIERWGLSRTSQDSVSETLGRAIAVCHLESRPDEAIQILKDAYARSPCSEYCRWLSSWTPDTPENPWWDLAVRTASLDPNCYLDRGRARLRRKDLNGALADFDTALQLDPDRSSILVDRAIAWAVKGDLARAYEDATKAIAQDPRDPLAWHNRSYIQSRRLEFEAAERDVSEAIRLRPEVAISYVNRSGYRLERHDLRGAREDADRAIRLDPALALAWSNRGAARLLERDLEGAAADVSKALEIDPSLAVAFTTRSGLRILQGDVKAALADASRAIELDPTLAVAFANRAGARLSVGEWEAALADCDYALSLHPKLALAFCNRGGVKLFKGDFDGAIADLSRTVELDPSIPQAFINRSSAWRAKEEWRRALEDAEQAMKLAPTLVESLLVRSQARLDTEDWSGAQADATAAIEKQPRRSEAFYFRGIARFNLKRVPDAIADFEEALKVADPAWPGREEVKEKLEEARKSRNDGK